MFSGLASRGSGGDYSQLNQDVPEAPQATAESLSHASSVPPPIREMEELEEEELEVEFLPPLRSSRPSVFYSGGGRKSVSGAAAGLLKPLHQHYVRLSKGSNAANHSAHEPQFNMADTRKTPPQSSKSSLFTNFEDVQLSDEERVYLNAAAMGDVPIVRQSLEENDSTFNINCVDYMGRSALHLAVDSESMETIELLLDRINFECIEESLLHTISKGATKVVKVIIEHPNYIAGAELYKRTQKDPFFRTDEKSQFSPDITPLILAAHYNNHEIIQMFLSRNQTIDKPHPISCQCGDCVTKQNYDSLKRSRSRLNAYRALASPAYMALSSPDPIMTTFKLRQEMQKLAQVEKEFKNEYLALVEQCMNFACELMDLCRGTQEVEAVLSEGSDKEGQRDPLARLKMAMEYEEKKMGFMQSLTLWKKLVMWLVCVPLLPFFCLVYIVAPDTKIGNSLRCPASKFITHTLSHICFLILLAAATFRLDERTYPITFNITTDLFDYRNESVYLDRLENVLKATFRPANLLMTNVQICLWFWVLGLLWMECKAMYNSGLRVYLLDNYNWIDFIVLSVYLSSYVLRFWVDNRIKMANQYYNGTSRAREALLLEDESLYQRIKSEMFSDRKAPKLSYFMKASRFEWQPNDPEIVSDVLFAIANVISIARTTYLMPAFEVLGPLQISLGRMIGDITRFLVLFTLVLFAFMVGLHNLYWYYGSQTYKKDGTDKQVHTSEAFQGLPRTLYSLFWAMFGLVNIDSIEIKYPMKERGNVYATSFPGGTHATSVVEGVGMFLFALYHVAIIIVLVNMLIAMMSHSFEEIQTDCDVNWKFARTGLWMNYIDEGGTLPVPFNMIPTPKSMIYLWHFFASFGADEDFNWTTSESAKKQSFIRMRRDKVCESMDIEIPHNSYSDILQRLVRRYLFKLERQKDEGKDSVAVGADNVISSTAMNTDLAEPIGFDDGRSPPGYRSVTGCPDADPSSSSPPVAGVPNLKRRLSLRSAGLAARQSRVGRPSTVGGFGPGSGGGGGGPGSGGAQVQLLSIPQLDAIQRTLRILDVRLQHIQNNAKDEERTRQDIDHVRRLMSENQNALVTVVTVLSSIQEEVRRLSITVHKTQSTTFQITAPTGGATSASKTGGNSRGEGAGGGSHRVDKSSAASVAADRRSSTAVGNRESTNSHPLVQAVSKAERGERGSIPNELVRQNSRPVFTASPL